MAHVTVNTESASLACNAHMQESCGPSCWKERTATPLVGTEQWLLAAWLQGKDPAAGRVKRSGSVGTKVGNLNNKKGPVSLTQKWQGLSETGYDIRESL